MIEVSKLNESFTEISGDRETLLKIYNHLKCEEPPTYSRFGGFSTTYRYFAKTQGQKLIIPNGLLTFLSSFNITPEPDISEFSEIEIKTSLYEIIKLMPFEPYDYQYRCALESLLNPKQINLAATGAGKSAIIFLIIMFLYKHNKKGLLIVPNINLLTQLKQDFHDYFKNPEGNLEFLNSIETLGGGTVATFNKFLVISTWQSLNNNKNYLDTVDFIICDELHRYASETTSEIVAGTTKSKYKWGLTGTLPELDVDKMTLFGLFGKPKKFISSKELIDRGLATPIKINSIILDYCQNDKNIFRHIKQYPKQLQFLKEHTKRSEFVSNLITKVRETGNTLCLYSHTEHGKGIFLDLMNKLYPDIIVENKDITGKKSFEFQDRYGIYFLNGEDDAKTRELTRKILEEHKNAILVANFALLSTGVNIKRLHNLVLASPLKSYTTITQSIGRLMRLHPEKKIAQVYDIVDNFGIRKPTGIFVKQYEQRKAKSYTPEEFPIVERVIELN